MDTSLVAQYKELDVKRIALARELKIIVEQLDALENDIVISMDDLESGRCAAGQVTLTPSIVANVKDWNAFGDYIYEEKALHLLQRRPAITAIRDTWTAGWELPGVTPFTIKKFKFKP